MGLLKPAAADWRPRPDGAVRREYQGELYAYWVMLVSDQAPRAMVQLVFFPCRLGQPWELDSYHVVMLATFAIWAPGGVAPEWTKQLSWDSTRPAEPGGTNASAARSAERIARQVAAGDESAFIHFPRTALEEITTWNGVRF